MFLHSFKYKIKVSLRDKGLLFWLLAFPIVLGSLFKLSFGNYMQEEEMFSVIETAYIEGNEADEYFIKVLEMLKGDAGILKVHEVELKEAKEKLQLGEIEGIIINDENAVSLMVKEDEISQTILKSILDQYEQKKSTIENIIVNAPEKIETIVNGMIENTQYTKDVSLTDGEMDTMMAYFYALISMTCLYGGLLGAECVNGLKANASDLGVRKNLASIRKDVAIIADLFASIVIESLITTGAIIYLKYILDVNLGDKIGFIILTGIVGGTIGITQGMIIASIGNRISIGTRSTFVLLTAMFECFLGGLMIGNMKNIVEKNIPIINRINPSALISDALYCLNVYDDYERYSQKLGIMLVMSIAFSIISYLFVRREKYASI